MDFAQNNIAVVLGIPSNRYIKSLDMDSWKFPCVVLFYFLYRINVQVRRIGGAFGGKAIPPGLIGAAAAVAAQNLQKPVRITLDLETNMSMIGKRFPYIMRYEVNIIFFAT